MTGEPRLANGQKVKSFDNLINSPRSIEAMKNLGIHGKELDPASREKIISMLCKREKTQNPPDVLINLRIENEKDKRIEKKEMIIKERKRIIFEE